MAEQSTEFYNIAAGPGTIEPLPETLKGAFNGVVDIPGYRWRWRKCSTLDLQQKVSGWVSASLGQLGRDEDALTLNCTVVLVEIREFYLGRKKIKENIHI